MPSAFDVYLALYRTGWSRTWQVARGAPWAFAIPVVILALSAVLERYVAPLHELARWPIALFKALSWGGAFWVLTRLVIGARAQWGEAVDATLHRAGDVPALAWSALTGTLVFVGLEVGGLAGASVLTIASATPVLEYVLFQNEEVSDAARHAWEFGKDRWASWIIPQLALLVTFSVAWAVVVGLTGLIISFIDERFLILADLFGALLFGPLVHLVLVQRGVMFLELRRLTHRQRMYQART